MRLFTGIAIGPPVPERLTGLLEQLRPLAPLNWSPPANLHITTKFIGEWPEARLTELKDTLAQVPVPRPFQIHAAKLGYYPNPHQPKVFFAGVEAQPELTALAQSLDEALAALGGAPGCAREQRPYSPHITLARINNQRHLLALREHIAQMTHFEFGTFRATEYHLYLSSPQPGGSVYSPLASFAFESRRDETAGGETEC